MSAVDDLFQNLRQQQRKAFMPFVTAGDPSLQITLDVIRELERRGCSMCEVGIPYSDPIADGPVIQASYTRALDRKIRLRDILEQVSQLKGEVAMPLVTMVSYAIIYRVGLEKFVEQAQQAGFAGAIVPDLLVEEADAFSKICKQRDFNLIQLVTPTTPRSRAVRIAELSSGFLYYVSVTGITGEREALPDELLENVSWLRGETDLPICIGFGISRPEHVRQLAPVADGLIVGSAIVRRLADAETRGAKQVIEETGQYVASLLEALAEQSQA